MSERFLRTGVMGDTSIQWTQKVWNPTRGCSRVSKGCVNCYAEKIAARFINVKNIRPSDIADAVEDPAPKPVVPELKGTPDPELEKRFAQAAETLRGRT